MRRRYAEIKAMGAEVVVVSFAPVERLPEYRERLGWPFPVVSDPERGAYRAFGLESAGLAGLLKPRVLVRYLDLLLRGYRVRKPAEDVYQLGGDFVLDRDRRVVYAHRSADPADRPPALDLIKALESARAGGTS